MSNELSNEDVSRLNSSDGIDKSIPKEIEEIFRDRPEILEQLKDYILSFVTQEVSISQTFIGPLPPPEVLKGYKEVDENFPSLIREMAINQLQHRIQQEAKELEMNDKHVTELILQSKTGQWMAFVLSILSLGLSTVMAVYGHEVLASIIGGTTLVGLATIFIQGKHAQNRNERNSEK
jgi:uncharacterized membrane protein